MNSQKSREKTRVSVSNSQKSRVEREFFLSTLENREWKENFLLPLSKIESRKRNGKYQIFEIEREISLSTLDFSLESETLVNACQEVTLEQGEVLVYKGIKDEEAKEAEEE